MPKANLARSMRSIKKASEANDGVSTSLSMATSHNALVLKGLAKTYSEVLMKYQLQFLTDDNQVLVISKGRQIGFSWTMALYAIFKCLSGYSVYYNSYNERSGKLFIEITKGFILKINEGLIKNGFPGIANSHDLLKGELGLNNLKKIVALSSDETNFRGISGGKVIVIIDEAAYKPDLQATIKAAIGIKIWNAKIIIASTHNGKHHYFNKLCEETRTGIRPYSYHFIPIDTAIEHGIVKKICEKSGTTWTKEYEEEWLQEQIDFYGEDADEELFGIPKEVSDGANIIIESNIQFVDESYTNKISFSVRYWDFASSISQNSYYTASVRLSYIRDLDCVVVDNYTLDKRRPMDIIEIIQIIVQSDGKYTTNILEQEPGSSGQYFVDAMINDYLKGYVVDSYKPQMKKHIRLYPVGQHFKSGKLKLLKGHWNQDFINWIVRFDSSPQPGTNDLCDCLSGAVDYLTDNMIFG